MNALEMVKAAEDAYSTSRAKMVTFKVPNVSKAATLFYLGVLIELEPVATWKVATAATDGRRVFFNPSWFTGLSEAHRFAINAHECLHVAFEHHLRMQGRDLEDWNIACDLAINQIIIEAGFDLPRTMFLPGRGDFEDFQPGLSAEHYYEMLRRRKEEQKQQGQEGQQGGQPAGGEEDEGEDDDQGGRGERGEHGGSGPPGDGLRPDDGGDEGDEEGEQEGGGAELPGSAGQPSPDKEAQKDSSNPESAHADEGGEGGEGGEGSPDDGIPSGGCPDAGGCGGVIPSPACSKDETAMRDESSAVKLAVARAAQMARTLGSMPAGLEMLVQLALTPKQDPYEELREFITKRIKDGQSYRRPNRRYMQQGVNMPDRLTDTLGDLVVTMDCSGSVDQGMLDVFASRLMGILETFQCKVTILYHDIPVTHVQHWVPSDGPLKLSFHGGGGTSHAPVFEWINKADTEDAPVVVAFTDLYTTFPDRPPKLPVLWFVYGDEFPSYPRPTAPFGQVCIINR